MGVLVVSFDSVSDKVFEAMAADSASYPNVARFKREAYYNGGIETVFVTNTYPIHATISTGKLPKEHGVVSNLLPKNKNGEQPWAQMARLIKAKTIWDAAREKNLSTAAMLWPVTCGAKIDWHIPEVHVEKGQNLVARSLRYGGARFQLAMLAKYGGKLAKALKGAGQPALDDFTTSATCDLLKKRKPDLALVHLIAYDTIFHFAGSKGKEIETAKKAMDENLGRILESWGEGGAAIVFSDHAQIDVSETTNLHALYGDAVFEQVGGSAFVDKTVVGKSLEAQSWFGRYLTEKEMDESGYAREGLVGIAAKPGCIFSEKDKYKGAHGYPADYDGYKVFYAVRGAGFAPGRAQGWLKNRVTDITAIIANELDLDMDILRECGVRQA